MLSQMVNVPFTEDMLGANVFKIQAAITTSQEMAIARLMEVTDEAEEDILTQVMTMAAVAMATAMEPDSTRSR